ncbi:hypothetical protein EDD16DRAFT_780036 [Pisolithus croceorrhizus]|nr:hypothetical protein EV401DRAFT_580563 [Pisolithus croceorrhizus]KAI6122347.1 hypothetical protein EDD16DRAFT_780036 [Pisolithus croceorrhizus]KAI6142325.1 hypothetical protein EDD17DRAFT_242880 [Pisolithus thermaeus]
MQPLRRCSWIIRGVLTDIYAYHAGGSTAPRVITTPLHILNYSLQTHAYALPLARLFVFRALPGSVCHFRASFLFLSFFFSHFFVLISFFFLYLGISFGRRRSVGRTRQNCDVCSQYHVCM